MQDPIEFFLDQGLIHSVVRPIKHGKEASVHLCHADMDRTGHELAALKVYHPLDRRDFRAEAAYRQGEWFKDERVRRALESGSKFGREVQAATWNHREWVTLQKLAETPVRTPLPIAVGENAILMSYLGDFEVAAPQLRSLRPSLSEVELLWTQIRSALGHMLRNDVVHADLSPYNILVWDGEMTVIDFPQAVDPKLNDQAEELLRRDVQRIGEWFDRMGLRVPWSELADELWFSWLHADLIPFDYQPEF